MDKRSLERIKHQKRVFCSINSIRSLAQLLKVDVRKLMLLSTQSRYKTFTVPKKGGGERTIEAPGANLKRVLARLNTYLQSVYYFEKSNAAYGFILGVQNDDDRRNVLTNARKHIGRPYLLNIDLKEFFHTVTRDQVLTIFTSPPFKFRPNVAEVLADLTTYKGRLPMGTSTSPVLSNLACRAMDEALVQFADSMLWVYTRYADDMSFSSSRLINAEMKNSLRAIIKKHQFVINEKKVKLLGSNEDKIVTGLLVTDKVDLAPGYLVHLQEEIKRLAAVFHSQNEQGELSTRWVDQLKLQVRGRLNFAGFVLKRNHPSYIKLKDEFYEAINPPADMFGAISYRGFPYNF